MNVTHFFIICSTLIKQPNDYRENDTLRKKIIFLLFYDIFYAKIILYIQCMHSITLALSIVKGERKNFEGVPVEARAESRYNGRQKQKEFV